MPKSENKKGGGSKLNRTQTVTLRMDPKLRYLTDLAARTQRRTTSGFIEWAIEKALVDVPIRFNPETESQLSIADEADSLWDVDEPDRFVKLAINYPNLLTHDEQILWKIVTSNLAFWNQSEKNNSDKPLIAEHSLNRNFLLHYWGTLHSIVDGNEEEMRNLPESEIREDTNPPWE